MSRLSPGAQPVWVPNTNIFVSAADQLVIQVEISSMRSENLEITFEGRRLRVSGDRLNAEFEEAKTVLVHEMHCGLFEAVLELPSGYDLSQAKASYLNGMLSMVVPKDNSSPLLPPPTITLE